MEDSCSSQAFKIMADITPAEDLFYPTPPEGLQGAKEYAGMCCFCVFSSGYRNFGERGGAHSAAIFL